MNGFWPYQRLVALDAFGALVSFVRAVSDTSIAVSRGSCHRPTPRSLTASAATFTALTVSKNADAHRETVSFTRSVMTDEASALPARVRNDILLP